jgi:hypothetical protein
MERYAVQQKSKNPFAPLDFSLSGQTGEKTHDLRVFRPQIANLHWGEVFIF